MHTINKKLGKLKLYIYIRTKILKKNNSLTSTTAFINFYISLCVRVCVSVCVLDFQRARLIFISQYLLEISGFSPLKAISYNLRIARFS